MASELGQEIIDHSRPRDRPSPLVLCIYSHKFGGTALMKIAAPIVEGKQVFEVSYTGNENFRYALSHLKGVAKCLEGIVRQHESSRPTVKLWCASNSMTVSHNWWEFTTYQESKEDRRHRHVFRAPFSEGVGLKEELMDILETLLVL